MFLALVNKGSIKGISRMRELSPKTVYDKISFLHQKCIEFARDREREMRSAQLGRLYIGVDRQDYVVNWSDRDVKRNVQLTAVGSADNRTGYVFGMHANFEPGVDREKVEAEAILLGDFDGRDPSLRRYARYWMEPDFKQAILYDPGPGYPRDFHWTHEGALRLINEAYDENENIPDPEAKERVFGDRHRLPDPGMQIHFEYTVHAHFRLLRQLLANAGKIRFFMDQDDTLRAGCLSAFAWDVLDARVDAFFVQINKTLTVDDRRRLVRESKAYFRQVREALDQPDWPDWKVRVFLLSQQLFDLPEVKHWRDEWVGFPDDTMAEPQKAVCHLTDRSDYGLIRKSIVFSRASLHAIDRFFMQLRRRVMLLERPIATPSNVGRLWHGYSPYNPAMIQKLIDIYRVYYNYVAVGKDKKTPAMRLGMAKGRVRVEDIIYFSPH